MSELESLTARTRGGGRGALSRRRTGSRLPALPRHQLRSSQSTDPSQGPVGQDLHNGHAGARNVLSIFETGQLASTAHKQLRAAHAREALRGRLMDGELRIGPINR